MGNKSAILAKKNNSPICCFCDQAKAQKRKINPLKIFFFFPPNDTQIFVIHSRAQACAPFLAFAVSNHSLGSPSRLCARYRSAPARSWDPIPGLPLMSPSHKAVSQTGGLASLEALISAVATHARAHVNAAPVLKCQKRHRWLWWNLCVGKWSGYRRPNVSKHTLMHSTRKSPDPKITCGTTTSYFRGPECFQKCILFFFFPPQVSNFESSLCFPN